jgi:hypothetical protein
MALEDITDPLDCSNLFEGELEFDLSNYAEITKICPQNIRDLMRRDDWLKNVLVLLNDKLLEQCERINDLEEAFEILEDVINDCCYTYYDVLSDYVL